MNATNRVLNRTLLLVCAVLCLAASAWFVAVLTLPAAARAWEELRAAWRTGALALLEPRVTVAGLELPWVPIVVAAAALVLIALLVGVLGAQGGGSVRHVLRRPRRGEGADPGALEVDAGVADEILRHALSDRPDVHDVRVRAFRVGGEPALRVLLAPRRGADPAVVTEAVEEAVAEWDAVLGARVPVLLHLVRPHGARAGRPQRVV